MIAMASYSPQLRLTSKIRQRLRCLAGLVAMVMLLSGCSDDKQRENHSKPVCDAKLKGGVFQTLVGSGGVVSERTGRFPPKKRTAFGYCFLYGKDHYVEIDYLWYADPDSVKSPSASTVQTFKVGSATGYVEASRARVLIPCPIPESSKSDDAVLEVEVKDMPPARTLDSVQGRQFASAATIAARYIGGEVFGCSAIQSGASSGSSSPRG